jgi:predicted TIM-barrel fold metal-dependent hydrolase
MKAIDVHCHIPTSIGMKPFEPYNKAMADYYKYDYEKMILTEEEFAMVVEAADVKSILMAVDAETATGLERIPNDYVMDLVRKFPKSFIGGFASVDPWKGRVALQKIERAVKDLGMMGVKFHPPLQQFYTNDRRFYPVYELCSHLGVPVQFHTGTTGVGIKMRDSGIHLKYGQPLHLDDVAADFPDLTIIASHPSWPWQDEMLMILLHKENVFNELSGWSPKYFPPALKKEINGRLQDKFLFGSDYPAFQFGPLFEAWEAEGFKPEVMEKVFIKNAENILEIRINDQPE